MKRSNKKAIALCAGIILGISPSFADMAGSDSSQIRFTSLTRSTGLSSDQIVDIIQDHRRNIWMASDDGLNKFDGYEITTYKKEFGSIEHLSGNQLTSIASTKEKPGPLWIGTIDAGLNRFDPITGKSEWFTQSTAKGQKLLSDTILHLAISEDKFLWIGTDHGLNGLNLLTDTILSYDGEIANERISCISVLPDNQVWVGTEMGNLFNWNKQSSAFEKIWEAGSPITSLVLDNRNKIWIGTAGTGLFRFTNGADAKPQSTDLQIKDVTCLYNDHNGAIWIGTTQGIVRFDRDSGKFVVFSHDFRDPDSLVDNFVTKIFEDHSKMLWVTTRKGGTSRFGLDQKRFPLIRKTGDDESSLPHTSVWSMHPSKTDESIWIGTEKGIAKWNTDSGTLNHPIQDSIIQDSYIISILEDSLGRLWLGTKGNGLILRESDGNIIHFQHDAETRGSLPHNLVAKIFEDSQGRIWIGTSGAGICQFMSDTGSFETSPEDDNNTLVFVSDIAEDLRGNIWMAGRSGLFLQAKDSDSPHPFIKPSPGADNLLSQSVSTILPDSNGIIWVGTTAHGIIQVNSFNGELIPYNSSNCGLLNDQISGLVKDASEKLWIGTGEGISLFNIAKGDFRSFFPEDGLQRKGFNVNAVTFDKNHALYFGGPNGFNIIFPNDLPDAAQSPIPILTGLQFFGKNVIPGEGEILEESINETSEIFIPFDPRNQFAVTFANLDSRFPKRGVFRYMLKGFDTTWRISESDRRAQYSSLPSGSYRFVVQSSPDGRKWPDNYAQIDVTITPPWYRTWWFQLLALISLVLGTVLTSQYVIRSRMKLIQRREELFKGERDHAEAALARQLQHSMLIERTAQEFQEGVQGNSVLSDSMKNFAEQFGASHCLVHRLVEGIAGSPHLSLVGHYSESDYDAPDEFQIDADLPFAKKIIEANEVVLLENFAELPKRLLLFFDSSGSTALLAVRTTFLDHPNGIIILQRTKNDNLWGAEKIKLLHALSPQFGMAIAQINTTKKEEEYRDHLMDARHEAEVANRAKSDFLAKMTHELRTPLNAVIGFTKIIQEDEALTDRQRELVNIVNDSGEHLHDVINDILDLSKIEAGKLERNDEIFGLNPMLKSVYEMLQMKADGKGLDFQFEALSAIPGNIETDRSKLRQILINLLNNAIKFTDNGTVTLKVGASMLSEPVEKDGKLHRRIRINFEIFDTGRGISQDEIPKLFVKYSQTESGRQSAEEGTGLGLPIAKSFINLLNGDIKVESELGKGSSFRYFIDCEEIAADSSSDDKISMALSEAKARKINGFSSDLDEIRILIAEDQPTNRLLLKKILGKAGFQIEEAINGQEAIDKWKDWHPHLILMDEDMPVMRGSAATKFIKSNIDESGEFDPVIVSLTAYAMDQARTSAYEAGVQDFIAKPFRPHDLFSVISKHLGVDYTFTDAA